MRHFYIIIKNVALMHCLTIKLIYAIIIYFRCNCDKNAGQHLGDRNSEYPMCCPRCSRSNKRH